MNKLRLSLDNEALNQTANKKLPVNSGNLTELVRRGEEGDRIADLLVAERGKAKLVEKQRLDQWDPQRNNEPHAISPSCIGSPGTTSSQQGNSTALAPTKRSPPQLPHSTKVVIDVIQANLDSEARTLDSDQPNRTDKQWRQHYGENTGGANNQTASNKRKYTEGIRVPSDNAKKRADIEDESMESDRLQVQVNKNVIKNRIASEEKLDCPIFKRYLNHPDEFGEAPCEGGRFEEMSRLRSNHLHQTRQQGHNGMTKFFKRCPTCTEHILDEPTKKRHGKGKCGKRNQCRQSKNSNGDVRVGPWVRLYLTFFPDAERVPMPYSGVDGWLSQGETERYRAQLQDILPSQTPEPASSFLGNGEAPQPVSLKTIYAAFITLSIQTRIFPTCYHPIM
ncbi:hypothetical protein GQ44DRAFT_386045 [Phaeosphaeriaceae sp. PMI808]|nr:hypothetical protein GQ44DRAFT_386045 [Phaeosphaeriaceae sp. PMI808]